MSLKVEKTFDDLITTRMLHGTVTEVQRPTESATVDFGVLGFGTIPAIPISYFCQEDLPNILSGFTAFAVDDEVVVEWVGGLTIEGEPVGGSPAVEDLRILGFADGVPRECGPNIIAVSQDKWVFFYDCKNGACYDPPSWPTDHVANSWSGTGYRFFEMDSYSYVADFVAEVAHCPLVVTANNAVLHIDASLVVSDNQYNSASSQITCGGLTESVRATIQCGLKGQATLPTGMAECDVENVVHNGITASAYFCGRRPSDAVNRYEKQWWLKTTTYTLNQGGTNLIPGGWDAVVDYDRIKYNNMGDKRYQYRSHTAGTPWGHPTDGSRPGAGCWYPYVWVVSGPTPHFYYNCAQGGYETDTFDGYRPNWITGEFGTSWSLQNNRGLLNHYESTDVPFFGGSLGETPLTRPPQLRTDWQEGAPLVTPGNIPTIPDYAHVVDKTNGTIGKVYGIKAGDDWGYDPYESHSGGTTPGDPMDCDDGLWWPYNPGNRFVFGSSVDQVAGAIAPHITSTTGPFPPDPLHPNDPYIYETAMYEWSEPQFHITRIAAAYRGLQYYVVKASDILTGAEIEYKNHRVDREFGVDLKEYSQVNRWWRWYWIKEAGQPDECHFGFNPWYPHYDAGRTGGIETNHTCSTQRISQYNQGGNQVILTGGRSEIELFVFETTGSYYDAGWIDGDTPAEDDENGFTGRIFSAVVDPENPGAVEWAEGRVNTDNAVWLYWFLRQVAGAGNSKMARMRFSFWRFWFPPD